MRTCPLVIVAWVAACGPAAQTSSPVARATTTSATSAALPPAVSSAPPAASASASVPPSPPKPLPGPKYPDPHATITKASEAMKDCADGHHQNFVVKNCHAAVCKKIHAAAAKDCYVESLADGAALAVAVIKNCGQDICVGDQWLLTGIHPARKVPFASRALLTPDMQTAFVDTPSPAPPETIEIKLASGKESVFAKCVGAALAPSLKWIACHDVVSLYRLPIGGGKPVALAKDDSMRLYEPYGWRSPLVVFMDDGTIAMSTLTAKWVEP